jgi:metallo-beta-lactamase class B
MSIMPRHAVALTLFLAVSAGRVPAQVPAASAFEQAKAHLSRARDLAGHDLQTTEELQCNELGDDNPYLAADKDDRVAPAQVFDNLYFVGTKGVAAWVVKTSAGLILINSLHSQWTNSSLLAGFKKLGLGAADV